ncbi:MAG: MerR family transcriptional regulator [Candidatus Zixiibacteriota bacterium]|jgi:effector-binding domain-containing protein
MFKIGEFSKLSRVPVKTLRYYDEVGLLRPADVDRFTGYRRYHATQLPRLNRILALRDLGFSLEEISTLLAAELPVDEMRRMLEAKRLELENRAREEQERLARVEARLKLLEQEDTMGNYDVVIKKVEDVRAATCRGIIPTYAEPKAIWEELMGYLKQNGASFAGPCFALYHDQCYKEKDVDAEACQPISGDVPETARIKVRELPGGEMASTIHKGPYSGLNDCYTAALKWIEQNGYRVAGPDREIYLEGAWTTDDPEQYVTELQIPVEKA